MKNFLTISAVCIMTIIVALNINLNHKIDQPSKITLENIEALASSEGGGNSCYYLGSLDCYPSPVKVRFIN